MNAVAPLAAKVHPRDADAPAPDLHDRRIAILVPSLHGGGLERVMALLGAQFAAWGADVEFLLCGDDLDPAAAPAATRAQVLGRASARGARWHLARRGAPGALWPGVLHAQAAVLPALTDYLRRTHPQVLITAALAPGIVAAQACADAGVGTGLILTVHNTLGAQLRDLHRDAPLKHWGKRACLPALLRRAARAADAVVAVSAGVAMDFARVTGVPADRLTVIHNPVVDDALLAAADAPCPHPWLEPGQPPVLVGFGRLVARKRTDLLLEVHAALRPRLGQRLVIIGAGPQRAALHAQAAALGVADSVLFAGFAPNPYAWLSRASAMVMCSQYEGFGLVLAEALACGCPVVSTDCPHGPAEVLDHGRYGALVPVDDARALAGAITATLTAQPDRAMLRRRGMEFSAAAAARRYLDLPAMDAP